MFKKLLILSLFLFSASAQSAEIVTMVQFGANVRTALGLDLGTNGGIVVKGGDAGTPSVLNLTNATQLPSTGMTYNNGVVGATILSANKKFAETVSVLEFGADPTGVLDSAPAFTNAIKSNRLIIVPPGAYLMKSMSTPWTCSSPAQICAANATASYVNTVENFKISGYGATINIDPSIAYSTFMTFFKANNFVVEGLTINGNRTGLVPSNQNAGFAIFSSTNFVFRDINFASGFSDNGSAYAGDWLVHGRIENNTMMNVGQCADFAFARDITIDGNYAIGFGSGAIAGPKCWSFINDVPNAATNNTGLTITENEEIRITNNYVKHYAEAVLIAAGKGYQISGNLFEGNEGVSPSAGGYGVLIYYINSGAFSSVGFPPQDIIIDSNVIQDNGGAIAGAGVIIGQSGISNADVIQNIVISNNIFSNNNATGISSDGTAHAANINQYNNQFITGAYQATAIDSNTLNLSSAILTSTSGNTSLTSTVIANATSKVLTPGNWLVTAQVAFTGGSSTTVNDLKSSINTVNNALSASIGAFANYTALGGTPFTYSNITQFVGPVIYRVTSTQTVYCNVEANFGISTASAYCNLTAQKIQ